MNKIILKNSFIILLFSLICCFLYPQTNISYINYIIIPLTISLIASIYLYKQNMFKDYFSFILEYFILNILIYFTFKYKFVTGIYIFILLITIQVGLTTILCLKEKIKLNIAKISIIFSAIFIRIIYILSFNIFENQNDIGNIEKLEGHIGYIKYFIDNNSLPPIEMMHNSQFYHPPLFYYLSSIWAKFNLLFFTETQSLENVQYFTLFLNLLTIYFGYLILKKLNIKNIFAYLVILFIPTTIIFSGYINNDSLLLLLTVVAIYYFIKWREEEYRLLYMIIISVCCSLGMMTKFSMAILIFIFIVFGLCEISKKNWKKLIPQFLIFGISQIGGIWFNIRCYLKIGSLLYMQLPINEELKINSKLSLFKINIHNFTKPYLTYNNTSKNTDSNYFLTGIKTFLFNECCTDKLQIFSLVLIFLTIIIFGYGIIKYFKNKKTIDEKNKFLSHYIILGVILHLIYIVLSPFFCTLNARYIYIQYMILLIYALQNKNNNKILKIISLFIVIFSILSLNCLI